MAQVLLDQYDETDMTDAELKEQEAQARRAAVLDSLGSHVARARSAAIQARFDSGIEDQWEEDEMYYQGVDDVNAGAMGGWRRRKPRDNRGTGEDGEAAGNTGSTIFPNITRAYCDAAAARMGDMLLPTDDRAFAILPTPVSDLIGLVEKGELPREIEQEMVAALGQDPAAFARAKERVIQTAKDQHHKAKSAADRAQEQVDDWLTEAAYHSEAREVIADSTRLGTGILKGPIPQSRKKMAWRNGELIFEMQLQPVSRRVDPWNCYPAAGCGNNVQDGDHHFERDDIGRRAVENLIGVDGYIDDQIKAVLREKAHKATKEYNEAQNNISTMLGLAPRDTAELYEIWYCYSRITREDLLACEALCNGGDGDAIPERESYDVVLEIINNRVVKASLNVLESGSYPYDYMVYQRLPGLPWGVGVARHIRVPQRMLVAAARNMMDNAGLSGGPMWYVHPGVFTPIDGIYGIGPRKGWIAGEKAPLEHLRDGIGFISMPNEREQLQAIIELAMRFAEESTGLPMILQGQQGDSTRTLGGMQMLNNNASTVLRRIARLFDDLVTEPHITRYYEWLLLYGKDDTAKGEFVIDARGSSALVERELQAQGINAMGELIANPVFGIDPKKWAEQWVKSQRLSYEDLKFTDDDWKGSVEGMAAQVQAGTQDSRVQVAQMQIEAKAQEGEKVRQQEIAMAAMEYEHEQQMQQTLMALRSLDDRDKMMELQLKDTHLDKTQKADLAKLIMQLETQIQLSRENQAARAGQAARPPTEPVGRAAPGQAFAA